MAEKIERLLEHTITVPLKALSGLNAGIVKVNRKGDFTFANDRFCDLAGVESWEGLNFRNLVSDESISAEIAEQLKNRFDKLVAEQYRLPLRRLDDGSKVYADVTAFPDTDQAGNAIESIAIVRDISSEIAANAIHECVNRERDWKGIFHGVATALKDILNFSWFTVSLYSEDHKHVRVLLSLSEDRAPEFGIRWYELPPVALAFAEPKRTKVVGDVEAYFEQPGWEWTKTDQPTQEFLQLGYKSFLWHPLIEKGQVVAAITLYDKRKDAFVKRHSKLVDSLPLRRALAMGLYHLHREDLEFRLGLIRDIAIRGVPSNPVAGTHNEISRVAKLLLSRIKEHYQWNNVSFFRVDENHKQFVLVDEECEHSDYCFGAGYRQDIDAGVLGYTFENGRPVRSGDVQADPLLQGRFERKLKGNINSELTIPINVNGKTVALLNSEDKNKNAYAPEEQSALELLVREVAAIYKTVELEQLLSAVVKSARDAIIKTDGNGTIQWINDGATELLGYRSQQLLDTSLAQYFVDPMLANFFLKADSVPNDVVLLSCGDGANKSVLISGSSLPEEFGGRVYIVSDMSLPKRTERLENLDRLYREIAIQSQVPLSLCFSWLRRLSKEVDQKYLETLNKVIRQLNKVQITFDRLNMFERDGTTIPYHPVLLDLEYILSSVRDEMPLSEADHIVIDATHDLPPIRGDLFQIGLCVRGILSYLTRFLSPNGRIHISAKPAERNIQIEIHGKAMDSPAEPGGAYIDQESASRAGFEFALTRNLLETILSTHGGRLDGLERVNDEISFVFSLPASGGELPT